MNRSNLIPIVFLAFLFVVSACSRTYTISNSETKAYKREVLSIDHVEKIKVYFRRPGVFIEVKVSEDISQKEIDRVLELTKGYATVSNMNKIAQQVKWNGEISDVYLEFFADQLVKRYVTHYFKTYDATDYSPENLDEYKTWSDVTPEE